MCLGFGLGLAPPQCSCKAFVPLSSIKMTLVMKIVGIVMAAVIIMMASMVRMMIINMMVSLVMTAVIIMMASMEMKDTNKAPDSTRTPSEVKSSCPS